YLFHGNKVAIWTGRVIFILSCFTGVLVNGEVVWSMGDIGVAIMAWINILSIVLLTKKAAAILKDYDEQRKLGKNPVFHPTDFEIDDETHVWDKYHEE
ncbi:MAG: alanine:cation symporter family protein, partial [Clostridia bacterium]|nr:alanine:cation symporter family protein [Clostridia bacterium]